eukprot:8711265-Pyramimonas_sp.AAC.1
MQKLTTYLVETCLSKQAIANTKTRYKRMSIGTREDPSAATTVLLTLFIKLESEVRLPPIQVHPGVGCVPGPPTPRGR